MIKRTYSQARAGLASLLDGVARGMEPMKVIGLSEAKAKLSSFIDEAEHGPVVITRNGKAVGVLIAPESDEDLERLLLSRSKKLKALLETRLQSMKAGQHLSHDDVWQHLD